MGSSPSVTPFHCEETNKLRVAMKILTEWMKLLTTVRWLSYSAALAMSLRAGIMFAGDIHHRSTAEDFLAMQVRPIAIGHHGVGPNTGQDPLLPIENTIASVRQAYE